MQMHQLDARVRKIKADLNDLRVRRRVRSPESKPLRAERNAFAPFENGALWAKKVGDNWEDFRFTVVTRRISGVRPSFPSAAAWRTSGKP